MAITNIKKVSDHFPEKEKGPKKEEKVIIKPKDINKKMKEVSSEDEECPEINLKERKRINDHFPEKEKEPKKEEKFIIKPKDIREKTKEVSSEDEESLERNL